MKNDTVIDNTKGCKITNQKIRECYYDEFDDFNNTLSGLPRLSGDFNRGYTKAIQDMIEIFKYIQDDLRHHHKNMSGKLAVRLLNSCLLNRENIRENVDNGFMRYNSKGFFEYYIPERKQ